MRPAVRALLACAALALPAAALAASATPDHHSRRVWLCDSFRFNRSALHGAAGAEKGSDAPAQALRDYLAVRPHLPQSGWRLLRSATAEVDYGHKRRSGTLLYVTVRNRGGAWRKQDSSECRPQLFARGFEVDPFVLDAPVHGSSRALKIEVDAEDSCDKVGLPRFHHAEVRYTRHTVTLTTFVRWPRRHSPPDGTACGGTGIGIRTTVHLPQPVGHRALRDGSALPATLVAHPR